MKIWKMKQCFYSDTIKELNNLEKEHAAIKSITQANSENWFTIFYTIEDDNIEEQEI